METIHEVWPEYAGIKQDFDRIVDKTVNDEDDERLTRLLQDLSDKCGDGETAMPFIAVLHSSFVDGQVICDVVNYMAKSWDLENIAFICVEAGKMISKYRL